MFNPLFLLFLALLNSDPARADGGSSGTRGGGDPADLRAVASEIKIVVQYLDEQLKHDVVEYLKWNASKGADLETIDGLIAQGLYTDIAHSRYQIDADHPCLDSRGTQKAATARLGETQGDICFSAFLLTRQRATRAELIALAIHEHAHHFRIGDEDYALMRAVKEDADRFQVLKAKAAKRMMWMPPR